ncbi:hypothetical protein GCM10012285_44560 [Streptomyces kronopolitis]|uniref:Uncharacterized protein n=1 Tax=Streptomyces kronopolitis TaxID=1612435 RepID=A0ABQ2JQL9_9ACTN|nr:hypothetical protein GCM10012285_44560 [Streptomyces kronopolitis]GLW19687.1 hypothetical protein Stsp01_64300 [Streptomyces sp. NBRC 13847]
MTRSRWTDAARHRRRPPARPTDRNAMRTFVLLLVYILFITPAGLLGRLVRDPMARRWNRSAATYWIPSADR